MNPLANPEPLIRRVYGYVAYRLGDGPDAEDVTSDAFERALRYRSTYDPRKGPPAAWLVGIARRAVDDHLAARREVATDEIGERAAPGELESDVVRRLALAAAVTRLDERDRELVALRYGSDLTARQIGELLDMRTNAVEVALHRALARLRAELGEDAPSTLLAPAPAPGRV
jgi:RNA polymerase sigma-70 factor (ECF subfamily)